MRSNKTTSTVTTSFSWWFTCWGAQSSKIVDITAGLCCVPCWSRVFFGIKNTRGAASQNVRVGRKNFFAGSLGFIQEPIHFFALDSWTVKCWTLEKQQNVLALFQSINYILIGKKKMRKKKWIRKKMRTIGNHRHLYICIFLSLANRPSECNHRYFISSFQFLPNFFLLPNSVFCPTEKRILGSIISV